MKSNKKRPASKGHRRVALLEEELGKHGPSNRKLQDFEGPTTRNWASFGLSTTLDGSRRLHSPFGEKGSLRPSVIVPSLNGRRLRHWRILFLFSPSVSLHLSRVHSVHSLQNFFVNFLLASKLRVGVQRPRRPGLITAESRLQRPWWKARPTSGLIRAIIRLTISLWPTCIKAWVRPRPSTPWTGKIPHR